MSQGHLATDCWLHPSWEGCTICVIDVALPHNSKLDCQWDQDELLMDLFLHQGAIDTEEKSLNRVHLHLHV